MPESYPIAQPARRCEAAHAALPNVAGGQVGRCIQDPWPARDGVNSAYSCGGWATVRIRVGDGQGMSVRLHPVSCYTNMRPLHCGGGGM